MSDSQQARLSVRVAAVVDEAEDIMAVELVPDGQAALPAFVAGAHIDVHLPGDVTRQYSICNDPMERHHYRIGILKDPASRGGSTYLHANLREGDLISIGMPRSKFPLVEDAEHSILLAGGIGITPILSMAYRLSSLGSPFALHCCARTSSRLAFRDLLADPRFAGQVGIHLDDGGSAQAFSFASDVGGPQPGTHIYVCGPAGFIAHVVAQADALGWPQAQVHVESFAAQPIGEEGDQPVVVTARRSGVTVNVAVGTSIAAALSAAGVDIPLACEQGICGTCVTPVLEGEPLHRDDVLSEAEKAANKQMALCCSWAKTHTLVLDA